MQKDLTKLCCLTKSNGKWYGRHFVRFRDTVEDFLDQIEPYYTYKQFREFFLDLVRYYMEKGLLKFVDCEITIPIYPHTIKKEQEFTKMQWKGSTATIDETIAFFDKHMPTGDEEGFEEDLGEEMYINDFFYLICPQASYWYDGSMPEYSKQSGWHDSD